MYPHTHFLFAAIIGMLFRNYGFITGKAVIITALLAVLIDIDHYINHVRRHKNWNFMKAWNNSAMCKEYNRTIIHHTAGIIMISLIILLLGLFSKTTLIILGTAYWSHILLDMINLAMYKKYRITKFGFSMDISASEISLDILFIVLIIIFSPVLRGLLGF